MSRNNPIPTRLREKFIGAMQEADNDDLPDGAWFAVLEDAAQRFIDKHRLQFADNNTAVHQYLRLTENKQ